MSASSSSSEPQFVAAIDFGTHGSGVAYTRMPSAGARLSALDTIKHRFQSKERSSILLNADLTLHTFGDEAEQVYREQLDAEARKTHFYIAEGYKMLLYTVGQAGFVSVPATAGNESDAKDKKDASVPSPPLVVQAANGKSVPLVTVIGRALLALKTMAIEGICQTWGIDPEDIDDWQDIRWVVTVPGLWTPAAKEVMRLAASEADFPIRDKSRFMFALEAEAAALECDHQVREQQRPDLSSTESKQDKGSSSAALQVVFDAGGGTLDVAVHRRRAQGNGGASELQEVIASTGGKLGSKELDGAFVTLLEDIFGATLIRNYRSTYPLNWMYLIHAWDRIKTSPKSLLTGRHQFLPIDGTFSSFVMEETALGLQPKTVEQVVGEYSRDRHVDGSKKCTVTATEAKKEIPPTGEEIEEGAGESVALRLGSRPFVGSGDKDKDNKVSAAPPVSFVAGQLVFAVPLLRSIAQPTIDQIASCARRVLTDEKVGEELMDVYLVGGFARSTMLLDAIREVVAEYNRNTKRRVPVIAPTDVLAGLAVVRGAVRLGIAPQTAVSVRVSRATIGYLACRPGFTEEDERLGRRRFEAVYDGAPTVFCDNVTRWLVQAGQQVPVDHKVTVQGWASDDRQTEMEFVIVTTPAPVDALPGHFVSSLCTQLGIVKIQIPNAKTVGGSGPEARMVTLTMCFGGTEIQASAVNLHTGRSAKTTLSFLDDGFVHCKPASRV